MNVVDDGPHTHHYFDTIFFSWAMV
jgi:hypothetical protein